jgi:CheY-like chemotaxis protein/transcriptional regulator with XRE-family HTH domain
MEKFGHVIKSRRKGLLRNDPFFSQQQLSEKIGIKQSYLSKIERGSATTLSEEKIVALAKALDIDPDYLLALGGKVSKDVLGIIKQRPRLFSRLVRDMKNMPEDVIEADHDFKQRQSRISHLYSLAGIAFFHLEEKPDHSVWSDRTPEMLNLPDDAEPSLETLCEALSQTSKEFFTSIERDACKKRKPYSCELTLKGGKHPTKYINVWGDCETTSDHGRVIKIGLIQDVTKSVLIRNELNEAKDTLRGTIEEQSQQVSEGIIKLQKEIAVRKILEAELREINNEVARKKNFQKNFFKKSAYQLRSLVNQLALEEYSAQTEESSPNLLGHISTAINNMNDFFEIEDGVQPLHDKFDPTTYFQTIFADIKEVSPKSSINIRLNLSPNLPSKIVADQQRIQQVFHSILGCLVPCSLWGSIQANIDYLQDQKVLILAFSSSAACERINKEYFYPLGNLDANTPSWKLTTIGPIIDGLKGVLDVKSTPSNGVDIVIQLPVTIADKDAPNVDKKQPILVVEDDEFSRLYTERTVSKLGFEVESVALGKDAIDKAKKRKYGLILLDIQLPDADGVTVAKEIRKGDGLNKDTRIIAVTAHATPEDRHRYEDAGINQFIAKPFKIDMLAQTIGEKPISGE